MEQVAIKNVGQGEYIKRTATAKAVYVVGHYDRGSDSYSCTDTEDMNREIFIKANKLVWIGFDY